MKVYVDPYIDRKNNVMKNLKGATDQDTLNKIEADYTSVRMRKMMDNPIKGNFDFQHLCDVHQYIFQDVYEWAGSQRIIDIQKSELVLNGLSVEYAPCDEIQRNASKILDNLNNVDWGKMTLDEKAVELSKYMADLWKVHPFREGNTRTTVTFFCDFAESKGFGLDRNLFKDNSEYVRTALVAASADFTHSEQYSYLGDRSKPEYLYTIVKDGMERGEEIRQAEKEKNTGTMEMSSWKNVVNSSGRNAGYAGKDKTKAQENEHESEKE